MGGRKPADAPVRQAVPSPTTARTRRVHRTLITAVSEATFLVDAVIARCADRYMAGETRVPCLECSESIKFRALRATARGLGAKVLAPGHFFFFSSRRRHTRFKCDWSSDVCSSDLFCL